MEKSFGFRLEVTGKEVCQPLRLCRQLTVRSTWAPRESHLLSSEVTDQ